MSLEKQQFTTTMKWVHKNQGKVRFDHIIQRNEVWNVYQKSMLINSLLTGFPINPMYALDTVDNLIWMLDGKQRLLAVIGFLNGDYSLHTKTPAVSIEIDGKEQELQLTGKYFKDLPQEAQEAIRDYSISIYRFKNMTDDEIEEFFCRLNTGGSNLNKMETTRVVLGAEARNFVAEIANMPFFTESCNLSPSSVNRFVDHELVLQIMKLVSNGCYPTDFGGKELEEFAQSIKTKNVLTEELQQTIRTITDYLYQALPQKWNFLKKVNVPIVFAVAIKAQKLGITPTRFGGWVQTFFANRVDEKNKQKENDEYNIACRASSAKANNVDKRLILMNEDFEKNIQTAPEYKAKPVKETPADGGKGRGGRPSNKDKAKEEGKTPEGENKPESTETNGTEGDNPVDNNPEFKEDVAQSPKG